MSKDTRPTQVLADLRRHYAPEFINRLDSIITFNRLSREVWRASRTCRHVRVVPDARGLVV
jgi:ATP-dependent Clp protease ATP-binding subunit ClpA